MDSNRGGQTPRIGENHMKLHPKIPLGRAVSRRQAPHVPQANPDTLCKRSKSDPRSLRMWGHNSLGGGLTRFCECSTINAPPINTMAFYVKQCSANVATRISDYKQAHAFFLQTDGP
ncbi:hypothetical protein QBC47DRAFT_440130 [Echria macrotheca]|uniref:Uncharacterized protein n=1 Tax=Echria macrotheca TaxID=438768 RepID=A0AAJ0B0V4_9PEZI|nr:hypothetical protein QBC47DRAFT_440130 [Echria macrotheca]